jgi:short-subunit dehydrogenase
MSVVLISRTQDKLKEAEQAIKAKSPVRHTRAIPLLRRARWADLISLCAHGGWWGGGRRRR